jgi:hypothetical protein
MGFNLTYYSFHLSLGDHFSSDIGICATVELHNVVDFVLTLKKGEVLWMMIKNPTQICHHHRRLIDFI